MIGVHGAADKESDDQCRDGKQQQHAQLTPNIAMVDARDGAAEGIDSISSWQPRAHVLEPFRQQWQRVGAAGTRHLYHKQQYRQGLAGTTIRSR